MERYLLKLSINIFFIFILNSCSIKQETESNYWKELSNQMEIKIIPNKQIINKKISWFIDNSYHLHTINKNSTFYYYFILEEVKKRSLPGEIALMPIIESSYNPFAKSQARAVGLWQMRPVIYKSHFNKTGEYRHLGINNSTSIALNYISYLHKKFNNNILLTIAAYHSGESIVRKAIRKNKSHNFWDLNLPKNTFHHVAKIIALSKLIQYQNKYQHLFPKLEYKPYCNIVYVDKPINLSKIATDCNIPFRDLVHLNPEIDNWHINDKCSLLVPIEKVQIFKKKLSSSKYIPYVKYKVKSKDTLYKIAKNNKTSLDVLEKINNIPNNAIIYAGTDLIVPSKGINEEVFLKYLSSVRII